MCLNNTKGTRRSHRGWAIRNHRSGPYQSIKNNLLTLTRQKLIQRLLERNQANGQLDALVKSVVAREIDPHSAAERLIANSEKPC